MERERFIGRERDQDNYNIWDTWIMDQDVERGLKEKRVKNVKKKYHGRSKYRRTKEEVREEKEEYEVVGIKELERMETGIKRKVIKKER